MNDAPKEKSKDIKKTNLDSHPCLELTIQEKRVLFGKRLREKREHLNQSKRDVIHLTRISPPFIDALESGNFDTLPGEVFGRGFIKNICRALEVDHKDLLDEYNNCWEHKQVKSRYRTYSRRLGTTMREKKTAKLISLSKNLRSSALLPIGVIAIIGISSSFIVFNFQNFLKLFSQDPTADFNSQHNNPDTHPANLDFDKTAPSRKELAYRPLPQGRPNIGQAGSPFGEQEPPTPAPQAKSTTAIDMLPKQTKSEEIVEIAENGIHLKTGIIRSFLVVRVKSRESLRMRFNKGSYETKTLEPGLYRITFSEKIDLFCNNMSALEITYNGRPLGDFGGTRDSKQLSFIGGESGHKEIL